jgi:hypothetical protein
VSALALTSDGDLDISSGNLRVLTDTAECLAQKVRQRYRMFRGEWFADTRQGVPYLEFVLVKNPNIGVVRSVLRKVLETTEGVKSVDKFVVTYDPSARSAAYEFKARTTAGQVITGGSDKPFIVEEGAVS